MIRYKPLDERAPDTQYQELLSDILVQGIPAKSFHSVNSITLMAPQPMRFPLANGAPFITERSVKGFWRSSIGELLAFINGVHTLEGLREFKVNDAFWATTVTKEKCADFGLDEHDLGPGSYGPAMAAFPTAEGTPVNQIHNVIEQMRRAPDLRTHRVSNWIPQYCVAGPNNQRRVVTAPCHGDMHFRIFGKELHLNMVQRAGDVPIGVPSNMIQYAAFLIAVAHVLDLEAHTFYHTISDAHIYDNQVQHVRELASRKTKPFPKLELRSDAPRDIFQIRADDFTLLEYESGPAMKIPVCA